MMHKLCEIFKTIGVTAMNKNKYFLPVYICIFLLGNSLSNALANESRITVTGQGTVASTPDQAVCTIKLWTESEDMSVVKNKHTDMLEKVRSVIKEAGIDEKNILASIRSDILLVGVTSVYKQNSNSYNYNTDHSSANSRPYRPPVKFKLSSSVSVTLDDLNKIEILTKAFSDMNGVSFSSINYRLKDRSKIKEQAITQAIDDAKQQAKQLASLSGIRLGNLVDIQLFGTGSHGYRNTTTNNKIYASGTIITTSSVKAKFEVLSNDANTKPQD